MEGVYIYIVNIYRTMLPKSVVHAARFLGRNLLVAQSLLGLGGFHTNFGIILCDIMLWFIDRCFSKVATEVLS